MSETQKGSDAMTKDEWLAQIVEPALEPDLAICDPHHHLWDHPTSRYLLDEILGDIETGHRVESTVFVECGSMYRADGPRSMQPVGETEFVQGIAAMSASGHYGQTRVAAGIVSHADLSLGADVGPVLAAHIAASPNRFRGIRHATAFDESPDIRPSHARPGPGLMMKAPFREGFRQLAEMNLSFDAWFYHPQMTEFCDLASAFPSVTIVLDHFGGPLGVGPYSAQSERVFEEWKRSVAALEHQPNVHFKLGGINMKVNGFGWHRRDLPPTSDELVAKTARYYQFCINTFGPGRCMFESNFPVDKESCSYNVLWNAFKKMTSDMNADDRAALFSGTARRVYRLDSPV